MHRSSFSSALEHGHQLLEEHNVEKLMKSLMHSSLIACVLATLGAPVLAATDLGPTGTETIYFRGWPYKPDVVADNVKRYNDTLEGNVDYQTVTHGDYPALMEKALIAGDDLDIIYGNPATAVRFFEAGWIAPADDVPNVEAIQSDMYENARYAFTYKDRLLGLSYFLAIRGMMLVNTDRMAELGLSDAQPASWDEFYDQILGLNEQGVRDLYMPHWFNEFYGISWAFIWEVLNRGGSQIDPMTLAPAVTVDGPAGETLRDWKAIYNAGMVPEEVLSYNEAAIVEAFGSGRFLYSTQASYNLAVFNDPAQSKVAGKTSFLGFEGAGWGLLDSALYLRTSRERSESLDEDTKRFQSWYGYKDHDGKVFVGQRWANNSMLFSAYRTVMESDESKASFRKGLANDADYDRLLTLYANAPHPHMWKVVWAEEYNSYLRQRLGRFLINDEPVDAVIADLNEKISDLNRRHGLD